MPPKDKDSIPVTQGGPTYPEAEAKYTKAAKAELNRDLDAAFRLYVQAAEDFLHLGRTAGDGKVRAACKAEAAKSLERAERIKGVRRDVAPVARDHFSLQQQHYVLVKSSIVNGSRFPLWEEDPATACADVDLQPALSPEQQSNGAVWQRHANLPDAARETSRGYSPAASLSLLPSEIIQHIVSDCSVCGGISVSVDHHRRFGSKMVLNSLFPPHLSTNGQYEFRIMFNGAQRRILIDDTLPTYPDGTLMCMTSSPHLVLWPALVEKAYMKLMGGYDFPGSDSGTDLHALAGWIPEHVSLRSPDFQREKMWLRILRGYQSGRCVLTLGTGEAISQYLGEQLHLLPAHCYAVTGVQVSANDDRQLTIVDSWVKPIEHEHAQAEETRQSDESSRAFVLSWDAVCEMFDGIYLSWDPSAFRNQLIFHGIWETASDQGNSSRSSYFRLRLKTEQLPNDQDDDEAEIWFMLTRHIVDTKSKSEYIALHVQDATEPSVVAGPSSVTFQGEYTNGTHTLVRRKLSRDATVFSFVAAYDGEPKDPFVGFTVTVYSPTGVSWIKDTPTYTYTKRIDGAFTTKTAGGNYTHPTFMLNPQYCLRIHPAPQRSATSSQSQSLVRDGKAHVNITIKGSRELPVNVTMVWSQGQRVTDLIHNDVVVSSGAYTYGHAEVTHDVAIREYTLIVSAFDQRHLGQFSLEVSSSHRFDLEPIPQEGAGMFSKVVKGSWTAANAKGSPTFMQYHMNPSYEIEVSATTHIMLRLQLAEPSSAISLNVSLFPSTQPTSNSSLRAHITTSGPYADSISGVVTPEVQVQPGKYIAVLSTYDPGVQRAFKLIVYSTTAGLKVSALERG